MAQIKCGFCPNTTFEMSTETVKGARTPLAFVICASCGAVAGVLQMEDPSGVARSVAQNLADRLREIEDRLTKKIDDLQGLLPSP